MLLMLPFLYSPIYTFKAWWFNTDICIVKKFVYLIVNIQNRVIVTDN